MYWITRRSRVRLSVAVGTVAAERAIDGTVLAAVLFAALGLTRPLEPLPERIRRSRSRWIAGDPPRQTTKDTEGRRTITFWQTSE